MRMQVDGLRGCGLLSAAKVTPHLDAGWGNLLPVIGCQAFPRSSCPQAICCFSPPLLEPSR